MARDVAVIIAVHAPKGLPALPGALHDATRFARWATDAGYEVIEHVDRNRHRVVAADVYDSIDALVTARDVAKLVVFFSGHGVSKGPGVDFWILSDGCRNPNGPINVARSVSLARRCGIGHVALFADACRSAANRKEFGIEGAVIFPNEAVAGRVRLDSFFATLAGDPAVEVQADDAALEQAFGVFTGCLLDALEGHVPDAIESVPDHTPSWAVSAFPLADYLDEQVPLSAQNLRPPVMQIPDPQPGSRPPDVLCWVAEPTVPRELPTIGPDGRTLWDGTDRYDDASPDTGSSAGIHDPRTTRRLERATIERSLDDRLAERSQILSDAGRTRFETATGLSVLGAGVHDVASSSSVEFFEERDAWHVRAEGDASVMIDLGDGRFAAVATLRGYVGTIHVGPSGVDLVSYLPADNSDWFEGAEWAEAARAELAQLGAVAQLGFRERNAADALHRAGALRAATYTNPSYGVFAAYEFERAGDDDSIGPMCRAMAEAGHAIPFDLALLAPPGTIGDSTRIAPSYPLLRRGWALLDPERTHPVIRSALLDLASSAWATPTGRSGFELFHAVREGVLP